MPQNPSINAVCNLEETNVKVCYPTQASSGGIVQTIVGGTDISVDSSDPLNPIVNYTGASSTPDLQAVTDVGYTTTNPIVVVEASNQYTTQLHPSSVIALDLISNKSTSIFSSGLVLNNSSASSYLKNTNVTSLNSVTLEFPNKTTGSYTIATTDDITTPDLQAVTDVYNVTTNSLVVNDNDIITFNTFLGKGVQISKDGWIALTNGVASSTFKNTNVTIGNAVNLEVPNKASGSYTIATIDDLNASYEQTFLLMGA